MATKTQVTAQDHQEPYDPMKDLVEVYLPPPTGKEEKEQFVGLNGQGYQIRKGQRVRVPRPVADIINESERQTIRQQAYIEQLERQAAQREITAFQ